MRIEFNLVELGIVKGKSFTDCDGNTLSAKTLDTILAYITWKYMWEKHGKGEMTQINANNLKNISKDYKLYLEFLRKNEVIGWTGYEVGVHSRRYFFNNFFKEYGRVKKISKTNFKVSPKQPPNYMIIIDPNVLIKLESDYNTLKYVKCRVEKKIPEIYNWKSYLMTELYLWRFSIGDLFYNWKSGRLYTNFCYCSENSRLNNFKFNGNLVGFDVSNSFPLWFGVWCVNKGIDVSDYDFVNYCTDVKDGKIYTTLKNSMNRIKDANIKHSEEAYEHEPYTYFDAKTSFMMYINGKLKNDDTPKDIIENNIFKLYYPEMFNIVDKVKYKMYDELVKLETDFIMNNVVKELYDKINNIKIVTCHDGVYFEEEFFEQAQVIWNKEKDKIWKKLPYENIEIEMNNDFMEILDL